MFGRQHRMLVPVKNSVAVPLRTVFLAEEFLMLLPKRLQLRGECGFVHR